VGSAAAYAASEYIAYNSVHARNIVIPRLIMHHQSFDKERPTALMQPKDLSCKVIENDQKIFLT